ncbi:MAG: helix-turn-helix transcriptional regulator [Moheibacter sp.]
MKKFDLTDERRALGFRVAELRKNIINPKTEKPISQEELSLRTGHAKKTIGELERGNTNPRFETLLLICKELNITINQLFNFDMNEYIKKSKK